MDAVVVRRWALAAVLLSGCSAGKASYQPAEAVAAPPRLAEHVDVLLDRAPDRPFRVVGDLRASAIESPASIELMRAEAGRAGLDGIYWIDCAGNGSGRCTAKGFVYTDEANDTIADATIGRQTIQPAVHRP